MLSHWLGHQTWAGESHGYSHIRDFGSYGVCKKGTQLTSFLVPTLISSVIIASWKKHGKDRCFPSEFSSSHLMKEVVFFQCETGFLICRLLHSSSSTHTTRWLHNLLFCLLQEATYWKPKYFYCSPLFSSHDYITVILSHSLICYSFDLVLVPLMLDLSFLHVNAPVL